VRTKGKRPVVEVFPISHQSSRADGGSRTSLRRLFPDPPLLKDHADPCTGSPADLARPAHAADQEFKARGNPSGVDHLQTSPVPGEVADRTIQNGRLLVKHYFPRFQGPQTQILSMLVHPPAPDAPRLPPILRANGYQVFKKFPRIPACGRNNASRRSISQVLVPHYCLTYAPSPPFGSCFTTARFVRR
jgi:hypothetical protein